MIIVTKINNLQFKFLNFFFVNFLKIYINNLKLIDELKNNVIISIINEIESSLCENGKLSKMSRACEKRLRTILFYYNECHKIDFMLK